MTQERAIEYARLGRNIFLTGPAGSGKTFVLNQIIAEAKKEGKKVAITASTGIAATHLGGTTIHSWSGIGIADSLSPYQMDAIMQKEHLYKRFKTTDMLILDEISMFDAFRLDMVDRVLRAVTGKQQPFGGIQVIFSGDFFQLPPITRGGAPVRFAFEADAWQQMTDLVVCYLDTIYRQDENDPLMRILNEMRTGTMSEDSLEQLKERMNETLPDHVTPTRLYTHNVDVDALNDRELAQLSGKHAVYRMTSTGKKDDVALLKKYCMSPEELHVKIGAAVMCVKNNPKEGYVNGTLGTVVDLNDASVSVQTADGREIEVFPDAWAMEHDGVRKAQIMQIPLRLAWAITIHKSQGMTLDDVLVDLSKSFTPGMGYVALSRVRSLSGLYIQGMNRNALAVDAKVQQQDTWFRTLSAQAEK